MFAFRLCLALGVLHPDYLLAGLTSRQLAEWQVFFKKQPFGQDILHFMLARLTSMYVNTHKKSGAETTEADDFMPGFKEEQSLEEIKNNLRGFLASF